jgi:hypothetical protein
VVRKPGKSGLRNGEWELPRDSNLEYIDETRAVRLNLTGINARLQLGGDSLAVTLEARLRDDDSGLVYGELEGSGRLRLADPRGLKEAHWQITVRELLLSSLQGRLPANSFLPQGLVNAELWCADADKPWREWCCRSRQGRFSHGNSNFCPAPEFPVMNLPARDWRIDFVNRLAMGQVHDCPSITQPKSRTIWIMDQR